MTTSHCPARYACARPHARPHTHTRMRAGGRLVSCKLCGQQHAASSMASHQVQHGPARAIWPPVQSGHPCNLATRAASSMASHQVEHGPARAIWPPVQSGHLRNMAACVGLFLDRHTLQADTCPKRPTPCRHCGISFNADEVLHFLRGRARTCGRICASACACRHMRHVAVGRFETQSRYAADIEPISSRYPADIEPISSRYPADIEPRCSRYRADVEPET